MQVSRSNRTTSVFVLTWDDVDDIVQKMSKYCQKITIAASCSDHLERKFENLEELRNFQNSEKSSIKELQIKARSDDYKSSLSVTFNDEDRSNFRFSIDADEGIAIAMNDWLEGVKDRVRPWYHRIATSEWVLWLGIFLLIVLAGKIPSLFAHAGDGEFKRVLAQSVSSRTSSDISLLIALGFFIPTLLSRLLNPIKRRYFPMGSFSFGDGMRREQKNETTRTVIIGGFAISILATVVTSWFL